MDDNENENLDYISSVDPFQPEKDEPSVDAPDEKALESVMSVVESEIKKFHTIVGVKRVSKDLSVEQRFEVCDLYTQLLGNLAILIRNAIDGVKEKQP